MMRIAIIEDEPLAEQRLRDLLSNYPGGNIEVVGSAESIAETLDQLDAWRADLLLCDIRLADGLSFNIWSEREVITPTIFTTAYEEYALRAFKVNSVDYLLKPINADELYAALDQAASATQRATAGAPAPPTLSAEVVAQVAAMLRPQRHRDRLMSKVGTKLTPLPVSGIAYFLSIDRISWAYDARGTRHPVSENLDELEAVLDPQRFHRLNRSCIAQASAVEQLVAYSNSRFRAVLSGHKGEPVIVARDRVGGVREWLGG